MGAIQFGPSVGTPLVDDRGHLAENSNLARTKFQTDFFQIVKISGQHLLCRVPAVIGATGSEKDKPVVLPIMTEEFRQVLTAPCLFHRIHDSEYGIDGRSGDFRFCCSLHRSAHLVSPIPTCPRNRSVLNVVEHSFISHRLECCEKLSSSSTARGKRMLFSK